MLLNVFVLCVCAMCATVTLVEPTNSFLLLEGMRNFGATRCTERVEILCHV
jgi:hypothetical protein